MLNRVSVRVEVDFGGILAFYPVPVDRGSDCEAFLTARVSRPSSQPRPRWAQASSRASSTELIGSRRPDYRPPWCCLDDLATIWRTADRASG